MKTQYFLAFQNDLGGTVDVDGPVTTVDKAKALATEYDLSPGMIFTILVQEGTTFSQHSQAIINKEAIPWRISAK